MSISSTQQNVETSSTFSIEDRFFSEQTEKRFQPVSPEVPAIVLDAGGQIKHLTQSARRLLEYKPDETIQPSFFMHVHQKNLYQVMRDVADMVCYGKNKANWLLCLRTGKDEWRWFKARVSNQLAGADGTITITLRDLNDL